VNRLLALALIGASVAACRTTHPDRARSEVAEAEQAEPALADAASVVRECPPPEVACDQDADAAVCRSTWYDDRPLAPSVVFQAFGVNACAARLALAKDACAKGLLPSRLGPITCAPDATGGHCPPDSVACGDDEEPTLCTASRYGDQHLAGAQVLKAWGPNLCRTREALEAEACRQNLDPKALSDINCGADPQKGECPSPEMLCDDALRPAVCEVKRMLGPSSSGSALRPGDAAPFKAEGRSACEAKQRLLRLICDAGRRPSDIEDMVCRFGL
jgi:hypothetical protein